MTIYWPETRDDSALDSENTASVFELPEGVLQRHGARMLRRTTAARARIRRAPAQRSTAYVSSILLIPGSLMETPEQLTELNTALKAAEVQIVDGPDPRQLDVTRTAALQPVPDRGGRPVDVDAWTALQAIRDANPNLGNQISLDHLMVVSSAGDLSGVPGAIQGFMSPFGLHDSVASGYLDGPVALEMPPVHRRDPGQLKLGRRAVVAVVDTGIGRNSRLEIPALDVTAVGTWKTGQFVSVDADVQAAVEQACTTLAGQGVPVEVITHAKDEPLTRNPLVGIQDWCFGHGEFCAGIIQQIAPDASVLAVRVMGSDGVARESTVVAALRALVTRVDTALKSGDMTTMVDIVSLSMGYPFEGTLEEEEKSPLAVQINALRERGVLVVAAAGNSASSARFFPACMSTHTTALATPPVINVGALNPNGSKALFGNENASVTCFATGVNVISTFPQDANASRQPLIQVPAENRKGLPPFRQSPDADDYTQSPFRSWTGTSFAAPNIAAHLANALNDTEVTAVTATAPETATAEAVKAAAIAAATETARKRAAAAVCAVRTAAQPAP